MILPFWICRICAKFENTDPRRKEKNVARYLFTFLIEK
jgi:hypothetical protein